MLKFSDKNIHNLTSYVKKQYTDLDMAGSQFYNTYKQTHTHSYRENTGIKYNQRIKNTGRKITHRITVGVILFSTICFSVIFYEHLKLI